MEKKERKKMTQTEILVKEVEKRVLLQVEIILNESKSIDEAKEKIKALIRG